MTPMTNTPNDPLSSLSHRPLGGWVFDDEVTRVFDDMLRRSIPAYEHMRAICFDIGKRIVQPNTDILDIGCSRGDALVPFVNAFRHQNRLIGIDVSPPMIRAAQERFDQEIQADQVAIWNWDVNQGIPNLYLSLTLCVLTLQFIPPEHRIHVLRSVRQHTIDGGGIILVEKVIGSSADIDAILVNAYYDMKHQAGYEWSDIERKRLSLQGVLMPFEASWNQELLQKAGFTQVDVIWRTLNFCGWLALT